MGNYLFKRALLSSVFESRQTVFDNVILAAADTNNYQHARWVDQINVRKRIFITINEDDYALRASRMKPGEDQKARLGHYLRELNANRPVYVDFTEVRRVGNSHTYFLDGPAKNPAVKRFFIKAFQGKNAESDLWYDSSDNVYRFWTYV
jgi:esterase/lipase superfamily enzyme